MSQRNANLTAAAKHPAADHCAAWYADSGKDHADDDLVYRIAGQIDVPIISQNSLRIQKMDKIEIMQDI